ncbi:MAG: hypothetical protein QM817_19890 [Archangium sp.]
MNIKPLLTGFAIGVLFAVTPGCGPKVCNASNCRTGCCDAKGECQGGASQNACGQLGGLCQNCALGTACNLGTCMSTQLGGGPGGGGGTGGGTTGGGTGGGTTGGGTGGGTTGGGTGGGATGGGTGGGTTGGGTGGGTTGGGTGGGGGCDGCLLNGNCIARANSNNDTFCGQNGVTCAMCTGTFHCQNFLCVDTGTGGGTGGGGTTGGGGGTTGGGTGGGTTGGGTGGGGASAFIGMSCTTSAQCSSLGAGSKCKTSTVPFGGNAATTYPPNLGFCTVTCPSGTCPGNAVCAGGVSTFPYLFNDTEKFCTAPCSGPGTCPVQGLACVQVTDLNVQGQTGCAFLRQADAGLWTGGGNPTKAGNTCTTDTDCANPPDPVLASCQQPPAFPNGYCTADSNLAPADTWCDQAGKTEVGFGLPDGGANFFCVGTCSTPGAVGTSRAGYTCFRKSATITNVGILWPKCTMASDCASDTMGRNACNTTSGFCCPTATSTTGCAIDFF